MMHKRQLAITFTSASLVLAAIGYSITDAHRDDTPSDASSVRIVPAPTAGFQQVSTSQKHVVPVTANVPNRASFKEMYGELLGRANEGDTQASKKLFRTTLQCRSAAAFLSFAEHNSCNRPVDPDTERACAQQNAEMPIRVQRARDDRAACIGILDSDLEQMRYQATMIAAKAGDPDAQACAVAGEFDLRATSISQEELEQYKSDVSGYFEAGLRRGDWRVVQSMTLSEQALSHMRAILFSPEQGKDLTIYRMTALLRQGASGPYADALDAQLKEYEEARSKGLEGFEPDQLAQARQWAKDEYQRYFVNSSPLSARPVVCGVTY